MSRQMFADNPSLIARLRAPLSLGRAEQRCASLGGNRVPGTQSRAMSRLAQDAYRRDPGLRLTEHPEDDGLVTVIRRRRALGLSARWHIPLDSQ
jgi:hypothetical protein